MLPLVEMFFKGEKAGPNGTDVLSCVSFPEVLIHQCYILSPKSFQTKQHHSHNGPNPTSLPLLLVIDFLFSHLKCCFKPEGMEGDRGGGRPCAISLAQG